MDDALLRLVWDRAQSACEYCHLRQEFSHLSFEVDHIIALSHGGVTQINNLALTCFYCNRFKGPNIAGIDPVSKKISPLFHPRRHKWSRHFRMASGRRPTIKRGTELRLFAYPSRAWE